jgi:prepilin-type N-terminal cleavage/methylation domain-containing protein
MSSPPSRRGFTLVEVMVAIAMAVVMMGGLMQILLNVERLGIRARTRASMSNNGAIAAQLMRQELGQAGLGVPRGLQELPTAANGFYAVVVLAAPTVVGVVADLARPDANFSTFGLLDDRHPVAVADQPRHLAWHTDNNGGCMPQTGAGSCTTANSSAFFPGEAGCATAATGAQARTCPWGLKRLRPSERFQVVAANGRWHGVDNLSPLTSRAVGPNGMIMLDIGTNLPTTWANNSVSALPIAGASQGWVTSLDRVFFRENKAKRTLERIQCWGTPDTANASWPPAAATTAPATPCTTGQGMDDWEIIATDVESVAFTYFNANGVALTDIDSATKKRSIRRIEFNVLFKKLAADQAVRHELIGGVFLGMAI